MHSVISPQFVSLIGLPGSGKTTLCRSLAKALGWPAFVIGDALRARAATDPSLREVLDRGELAPEGIAIELMREAAQAAAGKGLLIDGFPRHSEQIGVAQDLFSPWMLLYLRVPPSIAVSRLAGRLFCSRCNWVCPSPSAPVTICPQCGSSGLKARPEDHPSILCKRVAEADRRLADLLSDLRSRKLVELEANESLDAVLRNAITAIKAFSDDGQS